MDIDALEFGLLKVFSAIMRERSVTHAAVSLGRMHPAIYPDPGDPVFAENRSLL